MGFVDRDIAGQRVGRLGNAAAASGKSALDKGRHAVADHRRHLRRVQWWIAVLGEDLVQRVGQVRDAVDERAIEVEDQQGSGHARLCTATGAGGKLPDDPRRIAGGQRKSAVEPACRKSAGNLQPATHCNRHQQLELISNPTLLHGMAPILSR